MPWTTTFTQEAADEIVRRLGEGEPLAAICRDEHMPQRRTVSTWRKAHADFDEAFLEARDEGFDAIAYRARATARGLGTDDGGDSKDDVQRDKLIIETDLKLLAKWDPRRYGDRTILAGDPDAPLRGLSDEELEAKLKAKFEALGIPNG